jgi:hypothetical protein
LTSSPLHIPNLARMIGEGKYLNPMLYNLPENFEYTERLAALVNKTEGRLKFPPNVSFTVVTPGTGFSGTKRSVWWDMVSPGDYYVDGASGHFKTFTPLDGSEYVKTETNSQSISSYLQEETLPGLIPDHRQADFYNLRVSKDTGPPIKYFVHLSPRRPLTLSGFNERPWNYPAISGAELALNEATAAGAPWKFFHGDVDAIADAHYRYRLPKEILDAWAGLSAGDELPAGFLYLYNETTGTVIEDVIFRKPVSGTPYILEVESATFDFDAVDTASEAKANYESSGLRLITCGSPVSRSIWSLWSALYTHDHGRGRPSAPSIDHGELLNKVPPVSAFSSHSARYPTYLPAWRPANWYYDDHMSNLSRAGAQTDSARVRDDFNNAMLGHLLMANADTSGSANFLDDTCPDDSFSIYFGEVTGTRLYLDNGQGVRIAPKAGSGHKGLYIVGDTDTRVIEARGVGMGTGVYAYGTDGYAVEALSANNHSIFATNAEDGKAGVYGSSSSAATDSAGVWGNATGGTPACGIRGTGSGGSYGAVFYSVNNYAMWATTGGSIAIRAEGPVALSANGKISAVSTGSGTPAIKGDGSSLTDGVEGVTTESSSYGVKGTSTAGHGVYGNTQGAGKYAIHGYSLQGYAVFAEGDASAPDYAPFRILPANTDPANGSEGDIYFLQSTGIKYYDGSSWALLESQHSKSVSTYVNMHNFVGNSMSYGSGTNAYAQVAAGTDGLSPLVLPVGSTINTIDINFWVGGAGTFIFYLYEQTDDWSSATQIDTGSVSPSGSGNESITLTSIGEGVVAGRTYHVRLSASGAVARIISMRVDYTRTQTYAWGDSLQ